VQPRKSELFSQRHEIMFEWTDSLSVKAMI
jgi:hypothetical protein